MKRTHPFLLVLALVSLPLFNASHAFAISIGFTPVSQEVPLGDPAMVDLVISDLGSFSAPSLRAFDMDITYDSTILAFDSLIFGDPFSGDQQDLFGLGSVTAYDASAPGTINLFELTLHFPLDLADFQADTFVLASLTFDILALEPALWISPSRPWARPGELPHC